MEPVDIQVERVKAELARLECRRSELQDVLKRLEALPRQPALRFQVASALSSGEALNQQSPENAKIALFRSLFRGRMDVFPRRFESATTGRSGYQPCCRNEWKRGVCEKPRVKCAECARREFVPVSDDVIRCHLTGQAPETWRRENFVAGVYPLLEDETCWFVAADFDKSSWQADVAAFRDTCMEMGVPVAIERSRSGNGAHAWVFFAEPVPAALARRMATFVLTRTMMNRPELGMDSYDRLFPNQDVMPKGGFGNLIALPLQKAPRAAGNSVFVDDAFVPHADQWAYLSEVPRMSRAAVDSIAERVATPGQALGLEKVEPIADEKEPWLRLPSGRAVEPVYAGPKPEQVTVVLGNQIYLAIDGLPPPLRNELIRLAAFPNPEFFQAQALRLPIFNVPRVICCHEALPQHIGLPRGVLQAVLDVFSRWGIDAEVRDERFPGVRIKVKFKGELRPGQRVALRALHAHDTGVLAASTAFGKTVLAAKMIAERKVNTLILVHSRQLLDQWLERLAAFLEIAPKSVGQIRGGKDKPTGVIDVATIQSLVRKGVVDDRVAAYGQVIVDECHHISAQSFESVARQCKARYVLGLSATVKRKDGHHPIIFMQCGPVRFEITDQQAADARPFAHFVIPHFTEFRMPFGEGEKPPAYSVHQVFQTVLQDAGRNARIVADVRQSLREGRNPLVLTERLEHLEALAHLLAEQGEQVFVLRGGMGLKEKRRLMAEYNADQTGTSRVLLSTGRFLGEGFDDARLDTLFLAFPVSWRGTLTQYAGRLHRLCEGKKQVVIHDYADTKDPLLAAMYRRRCTGYRAIGYELLDGRALPLGQGGLVRSRHL